MIGLRSFSQRSAAAVAASAFLVFASLAPGRAAILDPTQMSADEVKGLQRRLTDAGCYKGAIDGTASGALDEAIQACPDQRPFLRIETGMHTAPIHSIGVDAACRLLATASDDKTVRLWSLPDGKLNKIVRLPIGEGNAGKVFGTALSPDGRWLATGGFDAATDETGKVSLTIVDLSSGAIRRFGAFEGVIYRIAFSADGLRVAVGLNGNNGVRVLDSVTGAELLADRDYGDTVYGLAFAPDGALITASYDGQLRRYGSEMKLPPLKRAAPDGKLPYRVAIDSSGRRVAIGYYDQTPVSILDANTLAALTTAQTGDVRNGDLANVAWSRDGSMLVAAGRAQAQFQGHSRFFLRRFENGGRRQGADIIISDNAIFDIQPCGDGFAFAAAGPTVGLLSPRGVATTLQGPRTADMRGKLGSAFAASSDATSVRFGLGQGDAKPVVFDLAASSLTDSASLPRGFASARVNGLPITDWQDNYAPKFDRAKLTLREHERSNALAIRPDKVGFALGTDFLVRAYDAKGTERWNRLGPGVAWGVDFSADGEIVVAAYDDGTIRWLRWSDMTPYGGLGATVAQQDGLIKVVTPFNGRPAARAGVLSGDVITAIDDSPTLGLTLNQAVEKMRGEIGSSVKLKIARGPNQEVKEFTVVRDLIPVSGGEELLALFVEPESRKWVAWTPSGYYMASAGGEDLIGWHVNRGREEEADFFPASQFRAQYNRPDIVRLVLKTKDEAEAIRQANAASKLAVETKPIATALPPVVAIVSPKDGSQFSGDSVEIAYSLRSPSGTAIDRLDVLADGQPIAASGFEKTNSAEAQGKVVATLERKDTKVSLIAHSGDLTSAPATVNLEYDRPGTSPSPGRSAADLLKPKLYALLVGVTDYANSDYNNLHFPAHDAESFAKALEAQKGGLYADVQTKVVDVPTRDNVLDGLYWLQRAATSRDLAIVFLSGHGFRDAKQNFWFLTRDADTARLRATAISNDDLVDLIASVPGKKVLFIDACHAGAATAAGVKAAPGETSPDMNKVVNDFTTAGSGLVVFAASTGTETAKEDEPSRHGAFTEALVEAIGEGKGSTGASDPITTDMLDRYIAERVKALTGGAQHPVMNRPVLIPDFPIALARP